MTNYTKISHYILNSQTICQKQLLWYCSVVHIHSGLKILKNWWQNLFCGLLSEGSVLSWLFSRLKICFWVVQKIFQRIIVYMSEFYLTVSCTIIVNALTHQHLKNWTNFWHIFLWHFVFFLCAIFLLFKSFEFFSCIYTYPMGVLLYIFTMPFLKFRKNWTHEIR